MWHTIDHDALAVIDTGNATASTEDDRGFTSAVVDHEFDGRYAAAGFNAHAFNFACEFCATSTLRVGDRSEVVFFESLAQAL